MRIWRGIFVMSLAILLLPACKQRKLLKKTPDNNLVSSYPIIGSWEHLSTKNLVEFKDGKMDESATMYIRMKKDSIIWFSVRKFGFEIVRVKALKDSVHILNKFKKEYSVYPVTYLADQIGLDLNLGQLQNVLIANPIMDRIRYSKPISTNKIIKTSAYHQKLNDELIYDSLSSILRNRLVFISGNVDKANVYYNDFISKDGSMRVPQKIGISASNSRGNALLKIQVEEIKFDIISSYPFKVSKSYVRKN